ncbi:MAG: hypothetical protein CMO55_09845 [Verrucomicrobiales bacterium]|nr:hypothetical protein [Verrucomicrobiales bacterium]
MMTHRFQEQARVFDRFDLHRPVLLHPAGFELWSALNVQTEAKCGLLFLPAELNFVTQTHEEFRKWVQNGKASSCALNNVLTAVDFHSGGNIAFELDGQDLEGFHSLSEIADREANTDILVNGLVATLREVHENRRALGYFDSDLVATDSGGRSVFLPPGLTDLVLGQLEKVRPDHNFFSGGMQPSDPPTITGDIRNLVEFLCDLPGPLPAAAGAAVRKHNNGNPVSIDSFLQKGTSDLEKETGLVTDAVLPKGPAEPEEVRTNDSGSAPFPFTLDRKVIVLGSLFLLIVLAIFAVVSRKPAGDGGRSGGNEVVQDDPDGFREWFNDQGSFESEVDGTVEQGENTSGTVEQTPLVVANGSTGGGTSESNQHGEGAITGGAIEETKVSVEDQSGEVVLVEGSKPTGVGSPTASVGETSESEEENVTTVGGSQPKPVEVVSDGIGDGLQESEKSIPGNSSGDEKVKIGSVDALAADETEVVSEKAETVIKPIAIKPSLDTVVLETPKRKDSELVVGFSRYPVSRGEWGDLMNQEARGNPEKVQFVTRSEAVEFLDRLEKRDRNQGKIGPDVEYRLPRSSETKGTDILSMESKSGAELPFTFVVVRPVLSDGLDSSLDADEGSAEKTPSVGRKPNVSGVKGGKKADKPLWERK